jgi:predicted nucleotidyltransferase component of viral defense system
MTPRGDEGRNVAASVHARLLALARARGTDFNIMLQRYVGERFLFRLGVSSEVDRFVLKGAALFLVWAGKEFRATRDLDFLATAPADHAAIRASIELVCAVAYPEDGLSFDAATIAIADIREDQEYGGVRVRLRAALGRARVWLQLDIGFGDVITPERRVEAYPTLLEHAAPELWTYPRETCVAEKFETMVRRGPANSRMRDFWDVAALAQHFAFDGETLGSAITETFHRRGTALGGELPDALRPAFYEDPDRITQWEAFQRDSGPAVEAPARLQEVGDMVRIFLGPVRESLIRDEPFTRAWPAGGPWGPGGAGTQGGTGGI